MHTLNTLINTHTHTHVVNETLLCLFLFSFVFVAFNLKSVFETFVRQLLFDFEKNTLCINVESSACAGNRFSSYLDLILLISTNFQTVGCFGSLPLPYASSFCLFGYVFALSLPLPAAAAAVASTA